MAVLEKIRVKFGILITALIAVALLSFIIDPQTLQQVWYSVTSKNDVGNIDGKSVSYEEFQKEVDKFSVINEVSTGSSAKNEEQQAGIRDAAWQSFIDQYLFIKNAKKAGINVSDAEVVAILSGEIDSPVFSQNPMFYDENGVFSKAKVVEFADYVEADESGRLAIFWDYIQNTAVSQEYYKKYMSLFNQSNYINPLMLTEQVAENNNTFDVEFVMVPYGYAKDTTVVVSDAEIKEYYKSHKKLYKQEASRDIEYVVFEIKPSIEDKTAANEALNAVYDEFVSTDNMKSFLSFNSDRSYDAHWYAEGELNSLSSKVEDFVSANNSGVSGVIEDGDSFYAVRILEKANVYDQVQVKVAPANSEDVNAELAAAEPQWVSQTPGYEDLMKASKGSKVTIGNVVFEVLDVKDRTPKKRVAILEKKVYASEKTKSGYYASANTFATKANGSYQNFSDAVDTVGLYAHPVNKMLESADRLGSIDNAKEVTRWAFEAKKGDVSGIMTVDNDYFVVAVLKGIHKEGYTPVSEVSAQISNILYQEKLGEKKAAEVAEKIAGLEDLQAIAEALGTTVSTKEDLAFSSMNSYGTDPKFIGSASVAEDGKICGPVTGAMGVYVYKVTGRDTGAFFTEDDAKTRSSQMAQYASQMVVPTMMDDAEVEDNRARFF